MKEIKLAHPSHFRTVMTTQEAERLLAAGWRLWTDTQAVNANALKQRRVRRKRKEAGQKRVTAYLSADTFAALMALKQPGETNAELFARMVKILHLL
ncbi:hypothetical protein [Pseudogulbenkiania subflava]|uniref:Uncharacterized protein n=1 Tax=Pseudogulbenkiania subflava DSM 22618 TaxID=1123014 RepID=A0A1Y6CFD9_9NEIS|nr:hypothetical protein [Pseudogulbenkiania subflava]SMF53413.1 hypothetical protein SAMN02745746_03816 [Pseudogulbenkiania subflava DSM 22618]